MDLAGLVVDLEKLRRVLRKVSSMIPWQTLVPGSQVRADSLELQDSGDLGEDQDQEDPGDPGEVTGVLGIQVLQVG